MIIKSIYLLGENFWKLMAWLDCGILQPFRSSVKLRTFTMYLKHDIENIRFWGLQHYYSSIRWIRGMIIRGERAVKHFVDLTSREGFRVLFGELITYLKLKYHLNRRLALKLGKFALVLISFLVCVLSINRVKNFELGLEVWSKGQLVGRVEDEFVFWEAEKAAQRRVIQREDQKSIYIAPWFKICVLKENQKSSERELIDRIMGLWGPKIVQASGIYIDGKFYGATTSLGRLQKELIKIKQVRSAGIKTQGQVLFQKAVTVQDGIYPKSSVLSFEDEILPLLWSSEQKEIQHIIMASDTLATILDKYKMTKEELEWLNGYEIKWQVGEELTVKKEQPLLDVKVVESEIEFEDIEFYSVKTESSNYPYGTSFYRQRGKPGVAKINYNVTYVDGVECSRVVVAKEVVKPPVDEHVVIGKRRNRYFLNSGIKEQQPLLEDANFIWPVENNKGYISCYFGGARGHRGIDLCAEFGTGILAGDDGEVISAGWEGSYGKSVVIRHDNGLITRYAHNSEVFVRVGQRVSQGEVISALGRTGYATGNHLHFEILANGRQIDPISYIT